MKQKIFIVTCLLTTCFMMKLKAQTANTFIIHGNIKTAKPSVIFLEYEVNEKQHEDSAQVTDGKFTFHGQVESPEPAVLYVNEKNGNEWRMTMPLEFYLESGNISIVSDDSISNSKITGGKANIDNAELQKQLKPLLDDWNTTLASFPRDEIKSEAEKNDSAIAANKFDSLNKELILAYQSFAKSHPNSFVSLYALQRTNGDLSDVTITEPIFNSFSSTIKNSKPGLDYTKKIQLWNTLKTGVAAPQFSLPDTSGKQVSLSSYKGKYVLVDFWASWCAPCRAENPNVLQAYNNYKDNNFDVVSISQDDSKENWIKAIHEDKLPWLQLSDLTGWDNKVQKLYDVEFIPQNYLIDPNGIIITRNLRGDELQIKLQQIFSN